MTKERIDLCGISIDNVTMREAVERIDAMVRARRPAYVITPNVDHLVKLQKDAEFREIYRAADLVLADGMPLLWAGRFLGTPFKAKVSGSDLLYEVCAMAEARGHRLFFLGGRPGAADQAKAVFEKKHPALRIVGTDCPPMGFEKDGSESARIAQKILQAAPDILMVGLGAPKQEKWIAKNYQRLGVPVSLGVGVSFEFAAGIVRRAPVAMQKTGFEWLWRLGSEPGRLWRRYLIDDPEFFWLICKQKFSKRRTA